MRSFDGRKDEQDDLHASDVMKGLGMNSHLQNPKSNSKQQVCINNTRFGAGSKATCKKVVAFQHHILLYTPQHMYLSM